MEGLYTHSLSSEREQVSTGQKRCSLIGRVIIDSVEVTIVADGEFFSPKFLNCAKGSGFHDFIYSFSYLFTYHTSKSLVRDNNLSWYLCARIIRTFLACNSIFLSLLNSIPCLFKRPPSFCSFFRQPSLC